MKKITLIVLALCIGIILVACGGGSADSNGASEGNGSTDINTAPEGITQSVYDDALDFLAVNDQYDAGLIDRATASNEAETIHNRLDRNASTELDYEVASYLRSALLKFKEPIPGDETEEAYDAMYERQIERAKDVLAIES